MNQLTWVAFCVLLAGCSAPQGPATTIDGPPTWTDSEPFQATYDLSMGIDQVWLLEVADPAGDSGTARFTLAGPMGAPIRIPDLCFEYSYEQLAASGLREVQGRNGNCDGTLSVAPEASVEGEILFELSGAELLPGAYSFRVTGGVQAASLTVELVAR